VRARANRARQVEESQGVTSIAIASGTVLVWAVTGTWFHYSDTWQLVINTGTTIVTFLMVCLIQRAQNKDSLAIHVNLNEIIARLEGASNRLINVEDLAEAESRALHDRYEQPIARAGRSPTGRGRSRTWRPAGRARRASRPQKVTQSHEPRRSWRHVSR
jgi:low affinity Fe/Cu permease